MRDGELVIVEHVRHNLRSIKLLVGQNSRILRNRRKPEFFGAGQWIILRNNEAQHILPDDSRTDSCLKSGVFRRNANISLSLQYLGMLLVIMSVILLLRGS